MGMGAHKMNVPEQFESYNVGRAELLIKLPSNWDINSDDEKWYWPIRLLKTLARYPTEYDTWLGCMHSVSNQDPFADNTELNGIILVMTEGIGEDGHMCKFNDTDAVNFYQVVTLYDEEINYKIKYGADKFLDKLPMTASIVDIKRKNVCKKSGFLGKLFG